VFDTSPPYRGRFAPSPTGPLHLGSLIAALASYLDARHHRGSWLVRMEDLDPPREEAGAARSILHSLESHGLYWDEDICWQSSRHEAYAEALQRLAAGDYLFDCECSRQQLAANGACRCGCRARQGDIGKPCAVRVSVPRDWRTDYVDGIQGRQGIALGEQLPDFVVRRKDALYAYQLAVVVDDAAQGITHIVRGSDLLDSTPRQIYLQQLLGYPTPSYAHLPVITNAGGQKLSKQNHAPALRSEQAATNLRSALHFLRQADPPPGDSVTDILAYASHAWAPQAIPRRLGIAAAADLPGA